MSSPSRSGAFDEGADPRAEQFTQSIDLDARLFREDIRGSIAHAEMLAEAGYIDAEELAAIRGGLTDIEQSIERGEFPFSAALEDIHMHIEHALIERIGEAGRKLHTARSRNDQISTAMRLWVRNQIDRTIHLLQALQRAFVQRCELDGQTILPSYTHLQRAQPVLAAHYWLAYCEKFERDRERLVDCRKRVNCSPLGCGAVAGTSLTIDRHRTALALGFEGLMANSLDSSGDRDFVLESVFCWSMIGLHLSGWAEEWIIWASDEFSMLQLPEAFCTGSSMMPQKINPDVLELVRGKASSPSGSLMSLQMLTRGLPTAYNRDLQEDKRHLFAAADAVTGSLEVAIPIVRDTTLKTDKIRNRLVSGHVDATTLMEYLVRRSESLRTAHHRVGEIVRLAGADGRALADLKLKEFQSIDPTIDESVYDVLGIENAVAAFRSEGSTGPEQVGSQIAAWRERLGMETTG